MPVKELINAMVSVVGDKKIKDQDCGIVYYKGKVYIITDFGFVAPCQNGVMTFGGFEEMEHD